MIKAIVTDIEGTTSSLSFVKDTLFPYARRHLPEFVRQYANDETVQTLLQDARAAAGDLKLEVEDVIRVLLAWIDQDRKVTSLKALQGLIWKSGYRHGDFCGHVYLDAVKALKQWQKQGIHLYVYSSGSVQAQQLLFAHTEYGDLSVLFTDYFDTAVGAKQDSTSYQKMTASVAVAANEILFLSDSVAELDAAAIAGWQTLQLIRLNGAQAIGSHQSVDDFSQVDLSSLT